MLAERAAVARKERHDTILAAAIAIAERDGWGAITRDGVAKAAGVADGSVNHAFGTVEGLRDAVMTAAVERRIVSIVATGLVAGHSAARDAPDDLKREAALSTVG